MSKVRGSKGVAMERNGPLPSHKNRSSIVLPEPNHVVQEDCARQSNTSRDKDSTTDTCHQSFTFCKKVFWSIQSVLVCILVFLVAGIGFSMWSINFSLAQRGVHSLYELTTEALLRQVHDHVLTHLEEGPRFLNILVNEMEQRRRATPQNKPIDPKRVLALFITMTRSTSLDTVFSSQLNGSSMGLDLSPTQEASFYFTNGNGSLFQANVHTDTLELSSDVITHENYYATQRPWFQAVVNSRERYSWVIYLAITSPQKLFLSLGAKSYDQQSGALRGITLVTYNLETIGFYLQRLVPENRAHSNTRIILIEKTLELVGSSVGAVISPDTRHRVRVDNHTDPIVRAIGLEIARRFGNPIHLPTPQVSFSFKTKYFSKHVINMANLREKYGIDWYVATITKEYDIMRAVVIGHRISVIVCAVCIGVALVIALALGCIITRPLKQISHEMKKIANANFSDTDSTSITSLKLFEIEQILNVMSRMKHCLTDFEKYVPSAVVKHILRKKRAAELGVVSREITVLLLDVRDFTTIAEEMDPNSLVSLMSTFFVNMSDIIMRHHGIIDKYLGDGICAMFNAPKSVPSHETMAVNAAVEMRLRLSELNLEWLTNGYPDIKIRIGINTATCLVGHVGSEQRLNYTALGYGVEIASRLEELNKRFNTGIIIGSTTYQALHNNFACRWLTRARLKKSEDPINIYEVLCRMEDASAKQKQVCSLHDEMKRCIYNMEYEKAKRACIALIEIDETNMAAVEMFDRLNCTDGSQTMAVLDLIEK